MSNEVIAFPDAEAVAITWLTGKLGAGVKISTRVPAQRPDGFVKVTRTGGVQRDISADDAQLTFECWALSEVTASRICELVRAHLKAAAGQTVGNAYVRKVTEVGGPANFPDPESTTPRYQYTASVACRGAAI
jgi:hypothetical protein